MVIARAAVGALLAATMRSARAVAQNDSTGVRLAVVPSWLPATQRDALLHQRGLLEIAVDSINAAIGRFNGRCASVSANNAAAVAACQRDYEELSAGAATLDSLKVKFQVSVESAMEEYPQSKPPTQAPASGAASPASTPPANGPQSRQKLKTLDDIKAASDELPDGATGTAGKARRSTESSEAVTEAGSASPAGATRYEAVVPDALRKDPAYQKLVLDKTRLQRRYSTLDRQLSVIRARQRRGEGDPTVLQLEAVRIKDKLAAINSEIGMINVKMEDLRVTFSRSNANRTSGHAPKP